jgi:hypothetical protein
VANRAVEGVAVVEEEVLVEAVAQLVVVAVHPSMVTPALLVLVLLRLQMLPPRLLWTQFSQSL